MIGHDVLGMSIGSTPKYDQKSRDFFLQNKALLSKGQIVSRVTIAKDHSTHPT